MVRTHDPETAPVTALADDEDEVLQPFSIETDAAKLLLRNDDGRAAFMNYWKDGTPANDRVVHVAIPRSMKGLLAEAIKSESSSRLEDNGNAISYEEDGTRIFIPVISDRAVRIWKEVANEITEATGIRFEVDENPTNLTSTNITVIGLQDLSKNDNGTIGEGSYPELSEENKKSGKADHRKSDGARYG